MQGIFIRILMTPAKRLEYAFKKIFVIIFKLFIRLPKIERVDPAKIKSILFLRHDWLGDVIISTPVWRLVKQHYPDLRVGVLATPAGLALLKHDPYIDQRHAFNKKSALSVIGLVRQVRARKYDAIVNLVYRTSFTGSLLTLLCASKNVPRIRLTGGDDKNLFYTTNIPKKIFGAATQTMVQETAQVLPALGVSLAGADLRLRIFIPEPLQIGADEFINSREASCRLRLGINLSAREEYREWSEKAVTEFIRLVTAKYPSIKIFIFSTPGSAKYASLKKEIKEGAVVFVPHNKDIITIGAMLGRMQALISPDTAMIHLASALNVAVVGLYYNREKAVLWRPFGVPSRILVAPTGKIGDISASDVLKLTVNLLEEIKAVQDGLPLTKKPPYSR
jgi:ADP-heptose:LPS heptosyltransferase